MTGAPVEFFSHDFYADGELWEILKSNYSMHFIISASSATETTQSTSEETMKKVGLISDHAYSVIGVFDLPEGRLVKLRNPWGHQEWTGDWADASDKWTDALKTRLNHKQQDDGVFFMSFTDYTNYYRSTTVCKLHDGFHTQSFKVNMNKAPFNQSNKSY